MLSIQISFHFDSIRVTKERTSPWWRFFFGDIITGKGNAMPTILITDTLFFSKEHEERLKQAGYDFERIEKPDATEDELVKAVKGKVGYLLGGIEQITEKVIDAADRLKVISFTGIDYKAAIATWQYATQKGIAITNTPDGPTNEVTEWALTAALMMNRHFLELGRVKRDKKFLVTKGLEGQSIGIIGLGRIGSRIAEVVGAFRPANVGYNSPHRHQDKESQLNVSYFDLPDLLQHSDVIFLCADSAAKNLLDTEQFGKMKDDALLVNITHPGVIVEEALYNALAESRIRAISDHPMENERFSELPLDRWYCMNTSSTITESGAMLMSDQATNSLLNILKTGNDEFLVNPDYR
jgi:phosphoglycerate dehydrogenase-like enzyme